MLTHGTSNTVQTEQPEQQDAPIAVPVQAEAILTAEVQEHAEATAIAQQEAQATADTEEVLLVPAEVQVIAVGLVLLVLQVQELPPDREEVLPDTAADAVQADPAHGARAADQAVAQAREVQAADRVVALQAAEVDLAEEETNSRAD